VSKQHILLVVVVPTDVADFASDVLWSAGAQAVQELALGDHVELVTDLGDHPLERWASIVADNALPESWVARTKIVDADVADAWRAHATTTRVADINIVPAWNSSTPGTHDVVIDPGGSFGMGDHPTTRATLELALGTAGSNALDLGCGSGVLAIALAKFRGMRCVAVDIAPAAIEAAQMNVALNGVGDVVHVEEGDVRTVRGTYDIVLANILAPVLLSDAADIALRVASRGTLILSGFMSSRSTDIRAAYEALGMRYVGVLERDGWIALQLESIQ
jgi:ribosomal protein L11 methyltransferase